MSLAHVADAPADWDDWVSASATRHHVLGDPLLDWLDLHGEARGFRRDDAAEGFDPRTDYTAFIFRQGNAFEAAAVGHLGTLVDVVRISQGHGDTRSREALVATWEAMRAGVEVIWQGVLWDPEHGMYGAPDLLVRADILERLFPGSVPPEEAAVAAPDLGGGWHYRVMDVKFTTLHLSAGGELANSGSAPAYKCQLFVYNRALGLLQGYEPPLAYLMGRGWDREQAGQKYRGDSCMDRLAPVPVSGVLADRRPIASAVLQARDWMRAVRREGAAWTVLPRPSRPELYPLLNNTQDAPWHGAKRQIAVAVEELTLLWQVGLHGRETAHAQGIVAWTDPRVTPAAVDVKGARRAPMLQALLDVHRDKTGPSVRPARIDRIDGVWRDTSGVDFYVDFETVTDLADDFAGIPVKGGQALIFMIGCGHIEDGEWRFSCFVAERLTEEAEARAINEWLAHMQTVEARLDRSGGARVVHWSPAEETAFATAYNSAVQRHPEQDWPPTPWFDFLNRVVKAEPVVVRGAMAFGLKAVARALHSHGCIQTLWADGPTDGLGAMVGAWWSYEEAERLGVPVIHVDLMRQIVAYNEVDCRAMYESIDYLRRAH